MKKNRSKKQLKIALYILLFITLLSSCKQKEFRGVEGSWFISLDEQMNEPRLPGRLKFTSDSLCIVDAYSFKHKTSFFIENDSVEIYFSDTYRSKKMLVVMSDSLLMFANKKYFRTALEYFPNFKDYELIGVKTEQVLQNPYEDLPVIHLMQLDNKPQVKLNDQITDLNRILSFLSCFDCEPINSVIFYIGKGVKLEALAEAYSWCQRMGVEKAILVIGNIGFDKFYYEKDYINVDDLLSAEFTPEGPPPLHFSVPINNEQIIIEIRNTEDIQKLDLMDPSKYYLVTIDVQISMIDYLDIINKLNSKPFVIREIKRLAGTSK